MEKASKPRIFAHTDQGTIDRMYSDYEPVFILSTGRSGSKFIAWLLERCPDLEVYHEPKPSLQYFSNFAFHNQDKTEVLQKMIEASRMELLLRAFIQGRIFVESNQCMIFFAPSIRDIFKRSKFVHIVRHPGDFARSALRNGFHRNDSIWESGRVRMKEMEQWDKLHHMEKLGWLWKTTHGFIETFKANIEAGRIVTFKAEDLFKDQEKVRSLFEFIGVSPLPENDIQEIQKTKVNELAVRPDEPPNMKKRLHFPKYPLWDVEMKKRLWRYVSNLPEAYGYDLYREGDSGAGNSAGRKQVPLLSVIIANYNNEPFIRQCIDSVLAQTYGNIEIVVCDDCSVDGSPAVIREYERRHPDRIKGLFLGENRGVAFARNYAAEHATGQYLTTLDSDDYYYNAEKLESEMKLVLFHKKRHRKDIIAFSDIVHVSKDGNAIRKSSPKPIREGTIFDDIMTRSCLIPRDFVVLRKAYEEIGGFDTRLTTHEDWDWKIKLAAKYEFHYTGIGGTAYRQHENGLSSLPFEERMDNMRSVFEKNIETVETDGRKQGLVRDFSALMELEKAAEERLVLIRRQEDELRKRQEVIETLHQAAQERLELIHRMDAELKKRQVVIEALQSQLMAERSKNQ